MARPIKFPQLHDRNWLTAEARTKTTREIADLIGCSRDSVNQALQEHDLHAAATDRKVVSDDAIVEFIVSFRERHLVSPTMQELIDGVGLRSKSTAFVRIHQLVRDGRLHWAPGLPSHSPRTILPTKEEP